MAQRVWGNHRGWRWQSAGVALLGATVTLPATVWAAAPGASSRVRSVTRPGSLTPQQRALQALNRLTFGPRPGDLATVERVGLDHWIDRQLRPETIDDSALEARLGGLPLMGLSPAALRERFPDSAELRRLVHGRGDLPADPVERAIWADAEALYVQKQAQKAADEGCGVNAPASGVAAAGDELRSANGAKRPAGTAATMAGPATEGAATGAAMSDAGHPATAGAGAGAEAGASAGAGAGAEPGAEARCAAAKNAGLAAEERAYADVQPMDRAAVQAVVALSPEARMTRVLAMNPAEFLAFHDGLRGPMKAAMEAGLSPVDRETFGAMQAPLRVVTTETLDWRLARDLGSERQLQAVMADFWLNHFNVYDRKNGKEPYLLPAFERDTVLPNAMGSFERLLVATAESPAMLMYLDNWESVGPESPQAEHVAAAQGRRPDAKGPKRSPQGINENYARELMELHTLGVNGGYTQADVIAVAKCFTGWTLEKPYGGGTGGFVFDPKRHEPGPKVVLGHTIPEGGVNEGLEVLHLLATSPATAKFIATKLAVRFVSDTPPPALVDRMAKTFAKTDGDLTAVLRTMLRSPEFWSPAVYRAKVKTPLEFVVSAVRASGATVTAVQPLVESLNRLGMPLFGMQTPNGYGWTADDWVSSNALIGRMNFALVLGGDRLPGADPNWPALLNEAPGTEPDAATEARLEALLLGAPASSQTRATVMAQFADGSVLPAATQGFAQTASMPSPADGSLPAKVKHVGFGGAPAAAKTPPTPLGTMAGLLLGSPEFQRR